MLARIRGRAGSALLQAASAVWPVLAPPDYYGCWVTPKRLLNYYRSLYEHRRARVVLRSYPTKLIIEPTNVCNLRCPACFTGDGQVGRARTALPLEVYRRLLAEVGDYLFRIDFCNWGEPLLAKDIFTMVEEAARRGISTLISTNFSFPFDDAQAERMVRSGLTILGVSLDGMTQASYEQYRVRGDLATVLDNTRRIIAAKRRLRSQTPDLGLEFHVFEHNQHEVERARALAAELDVSIAVEKGWVVGDDWDARGEWKFAFAPTPIPCVYLWQFGVVNNDGGVAPCCGSFYREDDVGRLSLRSGDDGAASFREVWNGPRMQAARRLYAGNGAAPASGSICATCPQTLMWNDLQAHLAGGGAPQAFAPRFTTNDIFHYFWSRRPAGATDRRARVRGG